MKNLAIFSLELIFFILASLQKPRQSIYNCICFALAVVDSKMVLEELLGTADLSRAQALCIHKATKIVVVCEDEHFMLATFQIVTPYFEGFDNSQKLAVVSFVSNLCRNHFSRKKCYWVSLAQIGFSDYFIGISSRSQLT